MKRKMIICIGIFIIIICIGVIININLNNSNIINTPFSNKVYLEFTSKSVITSKYIENFTNSIRRINNLNEINTYIKEYDDKELDKHFEKYNEEYFKEKSLILVAVQQESGSNKVTVQNVMIINNEILNVNTKTTKPEIGTADMAMNYLFIEIDNSKIANITNLKINK